MPRYRAPAGNRAVLAVPDRDRWPALVTANQSLLDSRFREERASARAEVFSLLPDRPPPTANCPLILTGHQPELFHPGVWVKNFAAAGLASQVGGVALNLIVDNDTLKSAVLRVPVWHAGDPASTHLQPVAFDRFDAETPYENRGIEDAELFRTFAQRAEPLWGNWGYEPLLPRVWAEVASHPAATIGERFTAARRCWEGKWGVRNLELPVSRLAKTGAFRRFAADIFANLDRFRGVYNAAVANYRQSHGIRSRSHPVPDLAPGEAPFWGAPDANGRRTRANSPEDIRPRALTLTLFTRLFLGDFFLHGIGGGKYDEVTDAIIRGYYAVEPPAFAVVSATLHLPVPTFPHTAADVRTLARLDRDRYWNPQLFAAGGDDLSRRKAALVAAKPAGRLERRRWYAAIRDLNERLRALVPPAESGLPRARREAAANAVLRRRDYPWVLYPEDVLRPFLQSFLP